MNSLSWMLYLTQAISGFRQLVAAGAMVLLVGATIYTVVSALNIWDNYRLERDEKIIRWAQATKLIRRMVVWGVCLGLAFTFLPNQRTMYMIAASQLGEQVVRSPEAQELYGDLKAKIKDMLAVSPGDQSP